jgi:hypothetical protein
MRRLLLLGIAPALLLAASCRPPVEESVGLEEDDCQDLCLVVKDCSGSNVDSIRKGGRGFRVFAKNLENFARGTDAHARLVIFQLSGNPRDYLFNGRLSSFRKAHPTEDAYLDWLLKQTHPTGSPCYRATANAVEFLLDAKAKYPRLKRTALLVFSDYLDNDREGAQQRARMVEALKQYAAQGGVFAAYLVDPDQAKELARDLKTCGFKKVAVVDGNDHDPPALVFD